MTLECKPCPVCGHPPTWFGSMIRDGESIGCNFEEHCPEEGAFEFSTHPLPDAEAIRAWNEAVDAYHAENPG